MKTTIKIALVLILLTGLSVFAFGETFLGFSVGFFYTEENYLDENFGRTFRGSNVLFSLHHYPGESKLGFYSHAFIGTLYSGNEYNEMGSRPLSPTWDSNITSLRLSAAPTYKLQLGEKIRAPVTIGPVFSFFFENIKGLDGYYGNFNDTTTPSYNYTATNLGLLGNMQLIVNPFFSERVQFWNNFYFLSGISLEWDFLRSERGLMALEGRNVNHTNPTYSPSMAFNFTMNLGFGIMLK